MVSEVGRRKRLPAVELEHVRITQQLTQQGPPAGADGKGGKAPHKLGTLKGVLIPTCENMWGVIIFLRFNNIVGNCGLGLSLLITTLSFSVALLTALSLSAIATCGTSQGLAGVYPMLARALGKEMATAVGLVYFLCIVFLAVLEMLGACEELEVVAPVLFAFPSAVCAWGSVFMVIIGLLVAAGIKLVSQFGLLVFIIVILTARARAPSGVATRRSRSAPVPAEALPSRGISDACPTLCSAPTRQQMLSFYISLIGAPHLEALDFHATSPASTSLSLQNIRDNWGPDYSDDYTFVSCLALFFPCFTGILSGANRASSLREPATAI